MSQVRWSISYVQIEVDLTRPGMVTRRGGAVALAKPMYDCTPTTSKKTWFFEHIILAAGESTALNRIISATAAAFKNAIQIKFYQK